MKSEKVYIEIILDSVRKIENSLQGVTKEVFMGNQEKQSAIILQLILIGENSNKIFEYIKSKISLPWRDIVGLRNMAVHEYMDLELDIIWDTANRNIPELKAKLLEYKNKS